MSAPRTPISGINRGLRGAHPPGTFEGQGEAREVLGLREECSPEVCGQIESIFRTLTSPEPGTLDRDELKEELDKIIGTLSTRRSSRVAKAKILKEREEMEKAEAAADEYRNKQLSGARWMARRCNAVEEQDERLRRRMARWERPGHRGVKRGRYESD